MNTNENNLIKNRFIFVKRIKATSGEMVYTVKNGLLTIQMDKQEAESVCRQLASLLQLDVEKIEIMRMIKNKANLHPTKQHPIGA